MIRKGENIPVWKSIWYFFPIQLTIVHLQRNLLLLFFWAVILAFLEGWVGQNLGIRYLFLTPEYRGNVNVVSFFIIGFALGGFIAAFQLSSYIINSRSFPFLATLSRPFFKYSLNNSFIPLVFLVIYVWEILRFPYAPGPTEKIEPLYYVISLLLGISIFTILLFTYFFALSRDLKNILSPSQGKSVRKSRLKKGIPVRTRKGRKFRLLNRIFTQRSPNSQWPVETYLNSLITIRFARSSKHYPVEMLNEVFRKNHFNTALFQVLTMISLLLLGYFRERPELQIPAGAAILLASTFFLMFTGFIRFFAGKWALVVVLLFFAGMDFLSKKNILVYTNYVYGLDYKKAPVIYDTDSLAILYTSKKTEIRQDLIEHENILDRWKEKTTEGKPAGYKPKIIFTIASGGGSKSAYWTMHCLQYTDSVLKGGLMKHTHLMTGSSGGMIGTSYFREIYRQKNTGKIQNIYADSLKTNVGKDLLNFTALTLCLNDLFIRNRTFHHAGHRYPKDRGYAFEKQLNDNTGHVLNKPLISFAEEEAAAQIPMLVFAPTIITDGRRLIISAQPMSFLSLKTPKNEFDYHPKIEDVEFMKLFKNHGFQNLTLTTAIRMNATFPFILPSVSLPTVPATEVMDAGIRDNYGFLTALKYMYAHRKWLKNNTDGIILLEMTDGLRSDYERMSDKRPIRSLLEGLLTPLGGIISNLTGIQVYQNQQLFYHIAEEFNGKLQHVVLDMTDYNSPEISMSLHLTEDEKKKIKSAIELPWNQKSIRELTTALEKK
jgi:hypothetical protein